MNKRILVIDDEIGIVEFLEINLLKAGFLVEKAYSGQEALEKAKNKPPDLILMDLMLPDIDGFELCQAMRYITQSPIIIITAKGEDTDKIIGLETGADDYVVKPFNPREIVARIHAIFRRLPKPDSSQNTIDLGRIKIDPVKRKIWLDAHLVELSPREYDILIMLSRHPGELISREELVKEVWDNTTFVDFRNVDVYIKHLRNKLHIPGLIRTVWGRGYQLIPPSKQTS